MSNIFEYCARNKVRFQSSRGLLSVEQLWDVPLRSSDDFNLNVVAKATNKALEDLSVGFVETVRTEQHVRLEIAFETIKHVISAKLADEKAAEMRAANKVEKAKLLEILAEKQSGKLSALSEKELQRRIAALEEAT